jgi:hypothetical protein
MSRAFDKDAFDHDGFDVEFWEDVTNPAETWTVKPNSSQAWTPATTPNTTWTVDPVTEPY